MYFRRVNTLLLSDYGNIGVADLCMRTRRRGSIWAGLVKDACWCNMLLCKVNSLSHFWSNPWNLKDKTVYLTNLETYLIHYPVETKESHTVLINGVLLPCRFFNRPTNVLFVYFKNIQSKAFFHMCFWYQLFYSRRITIELCNARCINYVSRKQCFSCPSLINSFCTSHT